MPLTATFLYDFITCLRHYTATWKLRVPLKFHLPKHKDNTSFRVQSHGVEYLKEEKRPGHCPSQNHVINLLTMYNQLFRSLLTQCVTPALRGDFPTWLVSSKRSPSLAMTAKSHWRTVFKWTCPDPVSPNSI